jgi:hypothetical protein
MIDQNPQNGPQHSLLKSFQIHILADVLVTIAFVLVKPIYVS